MSIVLFAGAINLTNNQSETTPVVVATTDIVAGSIIDKSDIRVVNFPTDFAPKDSALKTEEIAGRVAASTVVSGTPISIKNVVTLDQTHAPVSNPTALLSSESYNMVPIRLADPGLAEMLVHGDEVTIVTYSEGNLEGEPIATGGTVVFASTKPAENGSSTSSIPAGMVMIALPQSQAQHVAAASLKQPLAVVLTGTRANLTTTLK